MSTHVSATVDAAFVRGVANIPVGESSAVRVGGVYHRRDGFFESPDTGDQYDTVDRYGVKAQFLYRPSNALEVQLIADFARSDSHCCWSAAIAFNGRYGAVDRRVRSAQRVHVRAGTRSRA